MHLSYLIVGSGYRSKYYARIAKTYPDLFSAMILCRSKEKADRISRETGVPAVSIPEISAATGTPEVGKPAAAREATGTPEVGKSGESIDTPEVGASVGESVGASREAWDQIEQFRPDLIVIAVNKASIADVAVEWVQRGYPVLLETPAAMTKDKLLQLWELYKKGAKIAVAEQYHRYPELRAGLEAVAQGKIGTPGTAYLSLAHDYHGISLLRRMLLADGESYSLRGERTMHAVTETDSRTGPIPGNPVRDKAHDVIHVHFNSGKIAIYDFSGIQYHSFIRSRHLIVRGDKGEWCDTIIRRINSKGDAVCDILTPVLPERYRELDTALLRDWRRVWRPDLSMDNVQDEFAIASLLYDLRSYIEGGPEIYPLREALEDAYFRILMEEAVAEPWKEVRAEKMPWSVG